MIVFLVFILYGRKAWVQILVKHLPMAQSNLYLLCILRCYRCCSGNPLPRILQRVWRWRTSDVCNLRVLWTRTSNHACCQGNKVKLCPTQIVQFRIRHGRWIKRLTHLFRVSLDPSSKTVCWVGRKGPKVKCSQIPARRCLNLRLKQ